MRMKIHLTDTNDYVYVSKRAPSSFKSCMMFDKKHKIARIKEMFSKASEAAEQRKENIREESMKDVPTQSGNVAEIVKNYQTGQTKRLTSALDGVAEVPPAKRMAVMKEPPTPPPTAKRIHEGFPESTLSAMLPKAKYAGEEPVTKTPPLWPPPERFVDRPVPRKLPEEPPAPPPGVPTMPQREIPLPPTWSAPDGEAGETGASASAAAGPICDERDRFANEAPPKPNGPPPRVVRTAEGPVYFCDRDEPATSDPANIPTREPPPSLKSHQTQYYKIGATPDVDRGPPVDAAIQQPKWTPPPPKPSSPTIMQFVRGNVYQHAK